MLTGILLSTLLVGAHIRDFGAVCDGVADDTNEIQAALDGGGLISFSGLVSCRITRPLVCEQRVTFVADGPYQFTTAGASGFFIRVAPGEDGLILNPGCKHSIFEGFRLAGTKQHISTAVGIQVRTSVTLRDVAVSDFDSHGVLALCGDVDVQGRNTNCNLTRMDGITLETNGGWGMWISGGDSNTWLVEWLHCKDNEQGCLYTKSFLGSHYNYFHSEGPADRYAIFVDNPNARNVFNFAYIENPSPMHVPSPSVLLGGHSSAGSDNSSWIEGGVHYGLWSFYNDLNFLRSSWLQLGASAGPECSFAVEQTRPGLDGNPRSAPFRMCNYGTGTSLWQGTAQVMEFGDIESPLGQGSVSVGQMLYLGRYPNTRSYFWSDGLPAVECAAGDIRANSALSAQDKCALYACLDGVWTCAARVE